MQSHSWNELILVWRYSIVDLEFMSEGFYLAKFIFRTQLHLILVLNFVQSCALFRDYDRESFTVQTINLFDQDLEVETDEGRISLKGDWLFRRDRLELLDRQLSEKKANLLFFQNAMQRLGNWTDFDLEILKAGVFGGYGFLSAKIAEDEQTFETQLVGWGFDPSFVVDSSQDIKVVKKVNSGFASAVLNFYGNKILLINVFTQKVSLKIDSYSELARFIESELNVKKICSDRLIVSGALDEIDSKGASIQLLGDQFDLVDVGLKRCPDEKTHTSECQSVASDNRLAQGQTGMNFLRNERILLPSSSRVSDLGRVVVQKSVNQSKYIQKFFAEDIYPIQQSGWMASARLIQCDP